MHQPVLTLALGKMTDNINFSQQEISSEMRHMWAVFSKCKDSLENGRRLENMSWRLWFKSTMKEDVAGKQQSQKQQPNSRTKLRTTTGNEKQEFTRYLSSAASMSSDYPIRRKTTSPAPQQTKPLSSFIPTTTTPFADGTPATCLKRQVSFFIPNPTTVPPKSTKSLGAKPTAPLNSLIPLKSLIQKPIQKSIIDNSCDTDYSEDDQGQVYYTNQEHEEITVIEPSQSTTPLDFKKIDDNDLIASVEPTSINHPNLISIRKSALSLALSQAIPITQTCAQPQVCDDDLSDSLRRYIEREKRGNLPVLGRCGTDGKKRKPIDNSWFVKNIEFW